MFDSRVSAPTQKPGSHLSLEKRWFLKLLPAGLPWVERCHPVLLSKSLHGLFAPSVDRQLNQQRCDKWKSQETEGPQQPCGCVCLPESRAVAKGHTHGRPGSALSSGFHSGLAPASLLAGNHSGQPPWVGGGSRPRPPQRVALSGVLAMPPTVGGAAGVRATPPLWVVLQGVHNSAAAQEILA